MSPKQSSGPKTFSFVRIPKFLFSQLGPAVHMKKQRLRIAGLTVSLHVRRGEGFLLLVPQPSPNERPLRTPGFSKAQLCQFPFSGVMSLNSNALKPRSIVTIFAELKTQACNLTKDSDVAVSRYKEQSADEGA